MNKRDIMEIMVQLIAGGLSGFTLLELAIMLFGDLFIQSIMWQWSIGCVFGLALACWNVWFSKKISEVFFNL